MFRKLSVGLAAVVALLAPVAIQAPTYAAPTAVSSATPPAVPKVQGSKPVGIKAAKGQVGDRSSRALLTGPYFFHAGGQQSLAAGESATSLAANLHVELPYLDTANDAHSLGELAIKSHDQQQVVEIGTTHDPAVCGAGNSPCLFVFWWKNGVGQCYNGCGWVDYAPTALNVGGSLAADVGTQKRFQLTYSGGVWWGAYNGTWIGYFPGSLWTAAPGSVTFDKGGVFQGFYEVATKVAGDNTPCTDMGNGLLASNGSAARVGSISMTGTLPGAIANNFPPFTSPATAAYTAAFASVTTVRAGGTGYTSAGGTPGNTGSC